MNVRVTYDRDKDARNRIKHGLGLGLAEYVLNDPFVVIAYDRWENGEHRYHALGQIASKLLLLVHSYPDPDDENFVRAISLREATAGERRNFQRSQKESFRKAVPHEP